MTTKPFAFVLMPFEAAFDDIYKLGIQAIARESDVVAERVDEQTFSETILERIYRQIKVADFIIADMTGRNPNVFYEVGYAHALGKLCTLLTQSASDIPFDLRHHRHIIYDGSIHSLRQKLKVEFEWLKAEYESRSTSAFTVDLKNASGELFKTEWSADAEVDFLFDIHNRTDRRSPEIEAIYVYTGEGWKFSQNDDECASILVETEKKRLRHFVKSPVSRLSSGMWAQIKLKGRKQVWNKYKGKELKEKYKIGGKVIIEIATSEGVFTDSTPIELDIEELPF